MKIENKLRELLVPVFGLDRTEEIRPEHSLINDLGADSLDFVEIIQIIERSFGVEFKTDEFIVGGMNMSADDLFSDGKLTPEGASLLHDRLSDSSRGLTSGATKADLFAMLTVRDMARIISHKMHDGGDDASR